MTTMNNTNEAAAHPAPLCYPIPASMAEQQSPPILTGDLIDRWYASLEEKERARGTCRQYLRTIKLLKKWLDGRPVTRERLIEWKAALSEKYAAASVNTHLAAANSLLRFLAEEGGPNIRILSYLKVQHRMFCEPDKDLGTEEYERLVQAAREVGDERMSMSVSTAASIGIRVSELKYITVEAVRNRKVEIRLKGKVRIILIPETLAVKLLDYAERKGITKGEIFITRTGKSLSRGYIWMRMKKLAEMAGINPEKVFPHNLRHLFARVYYGKYKDISKLAAILGHSSTETTRLYLLESGREHARQLEELGLVQ